MQVLYEREAIYRRKYTMIFEIVYLNLTNCFFSRLFFKKKKKRKIFHLDYSNQGSRNDNRRQSEQEKEQTSPSRRISDGDVFIGPDTPASNEDENREYTSNKEETTATTRQQSRNWADCPIDESVVDTSPPSSINNTLTGDDTDDFQV